MEVFNISEPNSCYVRDREKKKKTKKKSAGRPTRPRLRHGLFLMLLVRTILQFFFYIPTIQYSKQASINWKLEWEMYNFDDNKKGICLGERRRWSAGRARTIRRLRQGDTSWWPCAFCLKWIFFKRPLYPAHTQRKFKKDKSTAVKQEQQRAIKGEIETRAKFQSWTGPTGPATITCYDTILQTR